MHRLAASLGAALLIAWVSAGSAHAAGRLSLDPFRPDRSPTGGGDASRMLSPFRVADAQPAAPAAASTPAPAPSPAPAGPKACQSDDDCPGENFCAERGVCEAIQTRTNILYLYYHQGSFQEVLGLYWSKKGPSGYKVVVPIYWHYWSPKSRFRAVAPFFWRYEDYATNYRATVIVPGLPISWSSQPDASSFAVWPIFYTSTKFGWAVPMFGSFKIADPAHQSSFGAFAFLFWWKRSPTRDRDVSPLYFSTRSPEGAFTFALPLTFYWREKDDQNWLVLPLLYANHTKKGGSLYSLIGYHTRDGDQSDGSLLWLYWYGSNRANQSGYDIFFPAVWSFHSPSENTTVAGPVVHVRRKTWYLNMGFPLWWSGGDTAKGEAFRTLLPVFYWERANHDKRSLWVTPIGGYSRDDVQGSRTLALVVPLIFIRRDRTSALHVITPAFIRYRDSEAGSTTHLALLFYRRKDPTGSTTTFFPLFWRFHDTATGTTATALLPFFAHRSGPAESSWFGGVFPAWAYYRSFSGEAGSQPGWGAGLFPLAFFGRRGDSSHAVFFPLFWRFSRANQATTVLFPLFYTHHDKHDTSTGVLPLLFFGHSDRGTHYIVQFPFFWHLADDREGWSTTVSLLGYHHSTRDSWSAGFVPLVFVGGGAGRSHFAFVPLFWRFTNDAEQKATTVVINYFHRSHGNETTDCLFPFIYYRRGARPGGSDETSFTLFPIVHYRRDADSSLLATLVGASWKKRTKDGDRAFGFIGPYLWWKGAVFDAQGVPFIYADITNHATSERTRQYGPWFAIDAPASRSRVLFPFYGRYDDAQEHDTYVFPTYFRQRKSNGDAIDTLFPFYWHSHSLTASTTVAGLLYTHREVGVHDTGVVPFYFYAKNDKRSVLAVPPLLLYRRHDFTNDSVRMLAAVIVYHTSDASSHSTVVFPLWWSGHDKQRQHRVLFPIYWHFQDDDAHTAINFLGPVFWTSNGTTRTRGLAPIAWRSDDSKTGASSNVFLPFFYESSGPKEYRFFTPVGGYARSETSHTWYALLFAASDGVERRFRMFAPFWFANDNKGAETKTRVIPPLLYVSRATPQTSLTTAVALFWHHRDIASSMTLGLPLYYDFDDFHESRTTVLVPFFVRHHRASDDTTYTVAPLFYRRSSPGDSTTVAFPLVWDFRHPNESTTVVFPFYVHWRRQDHQSTYIFPTYYYREGLGPKGPDGTYHRLLIPFFETEVKRRGDYMWEVLGGLFGRENVGRKRYLKVFFIKFESETPTHAQTAWYSKPTRSSRKEATRGLNGNVW